MTTHNISFDDFIFLCVVQFFKHTECGFYCETKYGVDISVGDYFFNFFKKCIKVSLIMVLIYLFVMFYSWTNH